MSEQNQSEQNHADQVQADQSQTEQNQVEQNQALIARDAVLFVHHRVAEGLGQRAAPVGPVLAQVGLGHRAV